MSADFKLEINCMKKPKALGDFSLVQLGRMVCHAGHEVPLHAHLDWYELTVITEGEGTVQTGNESIFVSRGDIHLSLPCETHRITSSTSRPLSFDFLSFIPVKEKPKKELETLINDFSGSNSRILKEKRLQSLCDGCVNAFMSSNYDKYEFVSLSLPLIAAEIVGNLKKKREELPKVGSNREKLLCQTIKNYIDTHIFSIGALSELSAVTSYNYSYLSSVFKNSCGETISDYYKNERFEKAKILLAEGGRSVTEISALLGYSSVYAFSKAFKDETGVSPKKYVSR